METQKELTRSWSGFEKKSISEKKIKQTLCAVPWTQNCSVCEKRVMTRREFNKRQVLYHVFNTLKSGLCKKDNNKTWTECSEKWSEYHANCMGCEGHLMKPQEKVNVENVKNNF